MCVCVCVCVLGGGGVWLKDAAGNDIDTTFFGR